MKNVLEKLDNVLGLLIDVKESIGNSYSVDNKQDMANALSLLNRIGYIESQTYQLMGEIINDTRRYKNYERFECGKTRESRENTD